MNRIKKIIFGSRNDQFLNEIQIVPSDIKTPPQEENEQREQAKIAFYNDMLAIIEDGVRNGKTTWNNEDDFNLVKEEMIDGRVMKTLDMRDWQEEMLKRLQNDFIARGFKCEFSCWDAGRFGEGPCGCTFTLKKKTAI